MFNMNMLAEQKAFQKIGADFETRIKYTERHKQREIEYIGKG